MKPNRLTEIIAALFILLFVYTAASKLLGFSVFRFVLSRSPLIGNMAPAIAWVLPFLELFVSLLLFFPRTRRRGLWASFILMVLFTGYLAYMIAFAPHLPCSCGGVIRHMTWTQHLFFNVFFTLLAATGLWWDRRKPAVTSRVIYSAAS
jgi:putative oxidoreductase